MVQRTVIGVDIGGTTTTAGLVDGQLQVIESVEQPTETGDQSSLLESLTALVKTLSERSPEAVSAIGFGIPSMIDRAAGRAVMSVHIPLAEINFVEYMSAKTGFPIFLDNDANVAALAEHRAGAGAGCRQMLMITIGTGIGGGIIIDGSVYRGADGSAAEMGHMVIDVNGPECPGACGARGCFEAMASGIALKRYALEAAASGPDSQLGRAIAAGRDADGSLVAELARGGDETARSVLSKVGYYLGVGITSLVNIFNPEVFVVGGGVSQAGSLLLDPAIEHLRSTGLKPNRDTVRVVPAALGTSAGMLGAACLALDELPPTD